ncbi:hypothetical protein IQ249_08800 [Lusitaniella coriacea LEGE 07157]|uniref:Uncharacterized protein n=1 Tax=Lusitaniella coriacea LEGE 07157 TaxID=945747 RepID=A0A8J7J826_9CYAN|nr:hypothetical protein [Lusitaniella coriacea]MBE9115990.1 hypothetical protein [Lusitaniella coriacea LEGE 07157]
MRLIEAIEKIELKEGLIQSEREDRGKAQNIIDNFSDAVYEIVKLTDPRCYKNPPPDFCNRQSSLLIAKSLLMQIREILSNEEPLADEGVVSSRRPLAGGDFDFFSSGESQLIEAIKILEIEEAKISKPSGEDTTQEPERELHRNFEKLIREIEGIFGNDRIFEDVLLTDPRCEGLTKKQCDKLLSRSIANNYLRNLKKMIVSREINTPQQVIERLGNIQRNIQEKPALLISQLQHNTLMRYTLENH